MQSKSDVQLLREYCVKGDEAAFREIVLRHTDLIYSAALRQVNSPDLAADVTQAAFTDLARKGPNLLKTFAEESSVLGWLYRSARFVALNILRDDRRRQQRERYAMEEINTPADRQGEWNSLAPVLENAMTELNDSDREAILLRFFKNQDFQKVGAALGVSDDTAQKRVSRALEKLRGQLSRRGVTLSGATIASALSAQAVQAAPAALSQTIFTSALVAGASTTVAAAGAFGTGSFMAMSITKSVLIAVSFLAATGVGIYQTREASRLRNEVQQLTRQHDEAMEGLRQELDQTASALAFVREENTRLNSVSSSSKLPGSRGSNSGAADSSPSGEGAAASIAELQKKELTPNPQQEKGREIANALVQGDPNAFERLAQLAEEEHQAFNRAREGLNDSELSKIHPVSFLGLRAAEAIIIEEAAEKGNVFALKAIEKALTTGRLKGLATDGLGRLAAKGNENALNLLLNPEASGLLLTSTVSALKMSAENGEPRAIRFLADVSMDPKKRALHYMSAQALRKAAVAGDPVALPAIIGLTPATNFNVRNMVVDILQEAAANRHSSAIDALRNMGIHPIGSQISGQP